ncbi:MAG TPA: GntR family transcriptional regulator [Candidatus Polarisedimenticolaceae bacterium]|nr:GntR family transcriptional regulator [Candidatus Polarisedimenticolaceae bacterium]
MSAARAREKRSPSAPRLAGAIREAILRGVYPSGVKLRQEELAASLGCSVIPLREALHTLASEGLVEFLPNRGARVRPVSSRELREMADVRSTLAAQGIRQAWPQMTSRTIATARAIVVRMDRARDPLTRVRLYADFHEAILAPANRPYLVATIRGIILSGLRYMPLWLEAWEEAGLVEAPGFSRVLDALERDDLASALELIQKVWSEQEGMLAAFLERRENAAAAKPKKRGGPKRPAPRKSR